MKTAIRKIDNVSGVDPTLDKTVLSQLTALKKMSVRQLRDKWITLFDTPPVSFNRGNLEMRIAYRLQELSYGGLTRETRRSDTVSPGPNCEARAR